MDIDGAPQRCTIPRIDINQGISGYGEVRDIEQMKKVPDVQVYYRKTDPRGEEYRDPDRSKEYELARNGNPNDTQTAL